MGNVERKVRADVEALVTVHPMAEALAEMSYALARELDAGAGLAAAAVNRELRNNLLELARFKEPDDDGIESELSRADLPPEVRNTP